MADGGEGTDKYGIDGLCTGNYVYSGGPDGVTVREQELVIDGGYVEGAGGFPQSGNP